MPAILSKNCIVGGELDWYCLACCALLLNTEDAVAHIRAAAHKHNLTELPYANKYKDDFIRKACGVYFCEVCEVTLPTAAKVGMHVTEATHVAGKTRRQLKRAGTAIVFQQNTLITESAWNGLVDDTCVLCNAEFDDESTHKSQQSHILNLINSSVAAVGAANDIYRKIDGGYQCLTCNKVLHEDGITKHSSSVEHKSAFMSYDQNKVNDVKSDDIEDEKSKDGDTTAKTKSRKADGKTLYTSPVLLKEQNKAVSSSDIMEVETLAKQHGLSMNKGSSNVYCSACCVHVTATILKINEHVDGKKHKGNLAKQSGKPKIQTLENVKETPEKQFVSDSIIIINRITDVLFVLINNRYFLKLGIFFGFAEVNNKTMCVFCKKELTNMLYKGHVNTLSHQHGSSKSCVISSLNDDFIRKVRQDLYQCLYCGILKNDFDGMMDHLDTVNHIIRKAELLAQMQVYKSEKVNYEERLFHAVFRGSPLPVYLEINKRDFESVL